MWPKHHLIRSGGWAICSLQLYFLSFFSFFRGYQAGLDSQSEKNIFPVGISTAGINVHVIWAPRDFCTILSCFWLLLLATSIFHIRPVAHPNAPPRESRVSAKRCSGSAARGRNHQHTRHHRPGRVQRDPNQTIIVKRNEASQLWKGVLLLCAVVSISFYDKVALSPWISLFFLPP